MITFDCLLALFACIFLFFSLSNLNSFYQWNLLLSSAILTTYGHCCLIFLYMKGFIVFHIRIFSMKYDFVPIDAFCGPVTRSVIHLNSLWPSDTIWRHKSGSILAQVMAWCLTAPSHYLHQLLTDRQWSPVTFILGQFHQRCLNHQSLKSVWKLHV